MSYAARMKRPFHLGPYPLEILPHAGADEATPDVAPASVHASETPLAKTADYFSEVYKASRDGEVAPARAPVPNDINICTADVVGAALFLDAQQVRVARMREAFWTAPPIADHTHAVVILVEHGRPIEPDNLAHEWVQGAEAAIARQRVAEIAACIGAHIRMMGFSARAHWVGVSDVDISALIHAAGLGVAVDGVLKNPWMDDRWQAAVVTTEYALAINNPLKPEAMQAADSRAYWTGATGAMSGRERKRRLSRASHLSRYPMEQVKRVDRPTTLILDDEVPRVPHRAAFFHRVGAGDLGAKAQRELPRFAHKHPLSYSMRNTITSLVPHQDGAVAEPESTSRYQDAAANSRAVKSLAYHLGADLAGICEVPRYAWYTHDRSGKEVPADHRFAVVLLIDQGFETMEGASGDDWISGAQSMRGYLRGAEIASIMAAHLRSLGFSSRSHTNASSQVLHIPLVLMAGLGEMSRIGELVLNPFVGPRFKSVVLTTDMPLEIDKPIDFGLQYFCSNCQKCARECPCDAIPHGDKVMFNGYEIWKPDVERCTRYRVTNPGGSACGRCMKTCPLNKVVDSDGSPIVRAASWLGVNAMWLKPAMVPIATRMDDWLGHGKRNLAQKWWLDLEIVDGVCVTPQKTNRRDIDPSRKTDASAQKIAYYPAAVMPRNQEPEPLKPDRKRALAAADTLETVAQARARSDRGEAPPSHYVAFSGRDFSQEES